MTILQPPQPTGPPTPDDCPLKRSILGAARQMFPGDPWEEVEPHLRRAWRSIREPTPWEAVREWMRAAWLTPQAGPAANDGDGAASSADLPWTEVQTSMRATRTGPQATYDGDGPVPDPDLPRTA